VCSIAEKTPPGAYKWMIKHIESYNYVVVFCYFAIICYFGTPSIDVEGGGFVCFFFLLLLILVYLDQSLCHNPSCLSYVISICGGL
jgi:hypothetical protein